jgi:hypothetical protein
MKKNINFARPLLILKKGKYCTQPYNRYRSVYLLQEHINNEKKLKTYLGSVTKEWGNGVYLFKAYVKDCNAAFTPTCTVAEVQVKDEKANVNLIDN